MKAATPKGRIARQRTICDVRSFLGDPSELVQNVLSVYFSADEDTLSEGSVWYSNAGDLVSRLSGLPHWQACGIAAALSPQNSWGQNVADVLSLVESGQTGQTGFSEDRAREILNGSSPSEVLGGRKVRSFYKNLLCPEDPGPVTVDRHAVSIAIGIPLYGRHLRILERTGAYQAIAASYRSAARELDILPNQVQAVSWLAWRQVHAKGYSALDPSNQTEEF